MKGIKVFLVIAAVLVLFSYAYATVIKDDMTYEGTVTFNGAVTQAGANTFSGATTLSGTTTLSGATTISGAATFSSTVLYPAATTTAADVLTAAECGKTIYLNSATEYPTTLPAVAGVSAGCEFDFYIKGAPSGASYIVNTPALENKIIGGILERETDTGDDGPYHAAADTITFVDGVSKVGDWAGLASDGSSWYLTGIVNSDGGATVTQED